MTALPPQHANTPDSSDDAGPALRELTLIAHAAGALARADCFAVALMQPAMCQRIALDAAGNCVALDDDGAPMPGSTPDDAARALAGLYPQFFRPRPFYR